MILTVAATLVWGCGGGSGTVAEGGAAADAREAAVAMDGPPADAAADGAPGDASDASVPDGMPGDAGAPDAPAPLCVACLSVRLGRPLVVRGPFADELDTAFNEVRLNSGRFRGFTANGSTYAVDGDEPWAMGGARTLVMAPGAGECGRWLNGTEKVGGVLHGWVHIETDCNYALGQTHKQMAHATSTDEGLTWSAPEPIITGTDSPATGTITGEGDCTAVNGGDGFLYAYCLRNRDWRTIVARAPLDTPGSGYWSKYLAGAWTAPALGGDATALGPLGVGAGRWVERDTILLLGCQADGLRMAFSADRTTFTPLSEPLVPLENQTWTRPAPSELYMYASTMSQSDASTELGAAWLLAHAYLEPGEDFSQRYLVLRDVSFSVAANAVTPQVGLALSRWYGAGAKDRWTTTAPVPGNYGAYAYEALLGYVMTAPHPTLPTVKLEDCVTTWPGHPDHLLTQDGTCAGAGYTRLRTAGYVYAAPQPDTVALYRCYNPTEQHHFGSTAADCEGLGTAEWALGYALAH